MAAGEIRRTAGVKLSLLAFTRTFSLPLMYPALM
jgi:hypothetical protein